MQSFVWGEVVGDQLKVVSIKSSSEGFSCNSYEWALSVTVPLTGWSSQNTTGQRPFIRITAPCRFFRERDFALVFFGSRGGDSFFAIPLTPQKV
ncbi:hypothetical protein TNIN_89601 [Trichonephila inaurata madagascariensis]|uniref:Uncharacterized protein n=1 Tax=Trichonephila inaurata madagascariensis TaxID=2747483 RepID=A0A8X6YV77_9ARAC|nr:hypothetical protein TNIN_89601 [Trichonephila inaurata madagascariensis]